jgi:hypothetical protein
MGTPGMAIFTLRSRRKRVRPPSHCWLPLLTAVAIALIAMPAPHSRGQVTAELLSDTVLDNAALLFARNAPYGRAINGVSFQTESLLTVGDYQYATWYHLGAGDEDIYLARRNLSGNTWQIMDTGANMTRTTNDAHNVISLGISGDGRIHLSYDHHGHNLRYRNSVAGAATGATWNSSILNAERSSLNFGGPTIGGVTYPQFVTRPDGNLNFIYRTGSSGNGNNYFATFNTAGIGSWDTPHEFINGTTSIPYIDPQGTSNNRNGYLNGVDYGPDGKVHVTWTWREDAGGTNHDILYAYSSDGGTTWKNGAGANLGSVMNLNSAGIRIDDNNAANGIMGQIDRRNTLMNQQSQAVDLDGHVHSIMWHADDAHHNTVTGFTTTPSAYFHYFRDPTTGAWSRANLPTSRAVGSRPKIGYDADGNVFAVYLSPGPGDGVGVLNYYTDGDLIIAGATKAANYTDWTILYTDTRDFAGEPLIDQARLLNDHILSVFIQENDDAVITTTGTPLRVLEFDLATPLELADYNQDGTVDAADFVLWRKADGSLDGYNNWQSFFGSSFGSGSNGSAENVVPEPRLGMISVLFLPGFECARRLRRRFGLDLRWR